MNLGRLLVALTLSSGLALYACTAPEENGGREGGEPTEDAGIRETTPESTPEATPDASGLDASELDAGRAVVIGATAFADGTLGTGPGTTGAPRPDRAGLLALPGGGVGGPVLTSNNPEIFTGNGVLYTNATSPTRGGVATPLSGDFGIYVHHLNQAGKTKWLSILVTNPSGAPVTVSLRGSGYSQDETGGLALGASPDYRVSKDWILATPATSSGAVTIQPNKGAVLWAKSSSHNREIDGRFSVSASAPVFVYVVATDDGSLQKSLDVSQPIVDAPGDYRASGNPPPPFGREAGVYAHDTWRSVFDVELPRGPKHVAFMVNTATGSGFSQVQAFPALTHYDVSAKEAVGMYGNVYDFDLGLRNTLPGATPRRVRLAFHSLANGSASRWWDGAGVVDGRLVHVLHVPGSETTTLFDDTLAPGEVRRVRFRAMVPGLAAIPQALSVESF